MSIGFLFWLLMVLAVFFNVYVGWPKPDSPAGFKPLGGSLLLFVLLFLLGWAVFGFVIKGP